MLKMGIEVTDKVLGVYDVLEVGPEQPAELLREHPLADTFLAAENDGDLTLTLRDAVRRRPSSRAGTPNAQSCPPQTFSCRCAR